MRCCLCPLLPIVTRSWKHAPRNCSVRCGRQHSDIYPTLGGRQTDRQIDRRLGSGTLGLRAALSNSAFSIKHVFVSAVVTADTSQEGAGHLGSLCTSDWERPELPREGATGRQRVRGSPGSGAGALGRPCPVLLFPAPVSKVSKRKLMEDSVLRLPLHGPQ